MNRYTQIALGITVAAFLLGCGGEEGGGGIFIPFPTNNNPGVRVFNGLDGQPTITGLYRDTGLNFLGRSDSAPFGSTSDDTIIPNTNITATINGTGGALFTTPPTIVRVNNFYTVYVGGTSSANYTSLIMEDSQSVAPRGTIGIRAIDMAANTGPIDIYLVSGTTFAPTPFLFSNLTYGNFTTPSNSPQAVDGFGYLSQQVSFRNPTYTVFVTPHGSQTILASTQMNPINTTSYSIAVSDGPNGSGTAVTVLPDQRPPSQ